MKLRKEQRRRRQLRAGRGTASSSSRPAQLTRGPGPQALPRRSAAGRRAASWEACSQGAHRSAAGRLLLAAAGCCSCQLRRRWRSCGWPTRGAAHQRVTDSLMGGAPSRPRHPIRPAPLLPLPPRPRAAVGGPPAPPPPPSPTRSWPPCRRSPQRPAAECGRVAQLGCQWRARVPSELCDYRQPATDRQNVWCKVRKIARGCCARDDAHCSCRAAAAPGARALAGHAHARPTSTPKSCCSGSQFWQFTQQRVINEREGMAAEQVETRRAHEGPVRAPAPHGQPLQRAAEAARPPHFCRL